MSLQVQAVILTGQPKSQNVAVGLTATFSATASGLAPITYQWRFEGNDLPGATNSVLSLTNAQPANAGAYRLVVTDRSSSATSSVAVLVVGNVAVWPRPALSSLSVTNLPLDLTNAAAVAASGNAFALALRPGGAVCAWGNNTSGYTSTNAPDGLTNISAIAVGHYHCVALSSNGTVTVWGNTNFDLTTVPAEATNVVAIAAGGNACLALRADGRIINWGSNWVTRQAPVGLAAQSMVAGNAHFAALTSAGTVKAWGDKTYGQLSVPAGLNNVVAIAAGANHTLALKGDGTVLAWGQNTAGQTNVPATATNVVAVMAGGNASMALRSDGSVVSWGLNTSGQLNPPAGFSNITAVALGGSYSVALRNLGNPVLVRGPVNLTNWAGQPLSLLSPGVGGVPLAYQWQFNGADIPGATNLTLAFPALDVAHSGVYQVVVSNALGVVTGQVATLTVRPQQSIAAWGNNGDGQCNVPAGLSNLVTIAAGAGRVLALKEDGTVFGWGASGGYQSLMPANLTNAVAVALGNNYNLALKSDGTVSIWGAPLTASFTNTSSPALWGFIRVAAGAYFNLGLRADGTVYGWADPAVPSYTTPAPAGLNGVVEIAAGYQHALALKADGTVVTWGQNSFGATDQPAGLSNVVAVAAGSFHSLALKQDGTVVVWGDNRWGQATVPAGLTKVVKIAASSSHSLALRSDGTVIAWGGNGLGQSQVPPGLSNVVAITAGSSECLALVADSSPCVTKPPRSQTLPPGLNASFRVTAAGTPPLSYQWQFNGVDLPGATDVALTISNVQSASVGCYAVVVSNQLGAVASPCGTLTLGPIAAWGENSAEQAWIPAGVTNPIAIAAGASQTAILKADGALLSWGNPWAPAPALPPIASLAAGSGITLAVLPDGTVTGWGDNSSHFLDFPPGLAEVKTVAVGETHALALLRNGLVVAWGSAAPDFGQARVPAGLSNVVAIAANSYQSLALRQDGTVAAWGMVSDVPTGLSNVVAIAAGSAQNLALKADGTVVPWGSASYGLNTPPTDLINVVAIGCGDLFDLALKADGTLRIWGNMGSGPGNIPAGLPRVVAASTRSGHIVVLTGDGRPSITVHPFDQSIPAGGAVTFNVLATGDAPLRYQWQFDGSDLPGATAPALTLTGVSASQAGLYRCTVSNQLGRVTSAAATLQVLAPPPLPVSLAALAFTAEGFKLRLSSTTPTGPIVLYSSTNLVDWQPVFTNASVMGVWDYVVPPSEAGQLFLRAVQGP